MSLPLVPYPPARGRCQEYVVIGLVLVLGLGLIFSFFISGSRVFASPLCGTTCKRLKRSLRRHKSRLAFVDHALLPLNLSNYLHLMFCYDCFITMPRLKMVCAHIYIERTNHREQNMALALHLSAVLTVTAGTTLFSFEQAPLSKCCAD